MKCLAAFDFDHTIIDKNSDTVIAGLIKGGIPNYLKEIHQSDGWTAFMQGVFDHLHSNDISGQMITDAILALEAVNGMTQLIKELSLDMNFDVIIISDSNSYFINTWLTSQNLKQYINEVFTNPAHFEGALKIQMYHFQNTCQLSTKNLCKGQILEEFIVAQNKIGVDYNKVIYVGDGSNDFCPILRLKTSDHAFVRANYKCAELVVKSNKGEMKDCAGIPLKIKANVHTWKSGFDILQKIKEL